MRILQFGRLPSISALVDDGVHEERVGMAKRRRLPAWGIVFHTEHDGPFGYRYQRLLVERVGKRASVRELVFSFDADETGRIRTDPKRVVRQRGRKLGPEECDALWAEVERQRPLLKSLYLCPDDFDPRLLDRARGPEGVPVAIHLGEEGPACLTLREGRTDEDLSLRRVLVARYPRDPSPFPDGHAPLREILTRLDPGLADARSFNYRKSQPAADLCAEFAALKSQDFLNLRRFEARALEALAWLGDPAGTPTLQAELFAPDPDVRLLALRGLIAISAEDAIRDAELLRHDDDYRVREVAEEVLLSQRTSDSKHRINEAS